MQTASRNRAKVFALAIAGLTLGGGGCRDAREVPVPARDPVQRILEAAAAEVQVDRGLTPGEHTLVVATRRLPLRLDPLGELEPWGQRIVDDALFEGLTRRLPDHHPFAEAAVAERCHAVPEDLPHDVYCHLREDLRFHDGELVTAADVDYSLQYWLDPRRGPLRTRYGLDGLKKVEIVDGPIGVPNAPRDPGRWIRISFAGPEPLALERIAVMKIVPRVRHRGHAGGFGRAPIGTGPMRVGQFDGDQLVLERVDERVAPDAAPDAVERIVFRAVPDRAEALTRLRRGEVHVVDEVAPTHVPGELTKSGMAPRFDAWLLTPPRYDLVLYNLTRVPQAGPQVRQALDGAIPFAAIEALHGMPSAAVTAPVDLTPPVSIDLAALEAAGPSATWGMAGLPRFLADEDRAALEAAGALLDEQGWPLERGVRRRATGSLRLVLMWDGARGPAADLVAKLRDAWRAAGVQVPYATASWSYVFGLMQRREYDLGLVRLGMRSDEDLAPMFHSRGSANLTGIADAELDHALEDYQRARDREARIRAKEKIAARLTVLRPVTVVYAPTQVMITSKRVTGLEFEDDLPRLDRVRLAPTPVAPNAAPSSTPSTAP